MATTTLTTYDTRIHWLQRGLAGAAVLATAPALCIGLLSYVAELYVATALLTTIPILLQRHPAIFKWACVIDGLALAVWGVLVAVLGMCLFLPSALLLLLAAFADPRRRPISAALLGGAGALVMAAVIAMVAWLAWQLSVGP